MIAVSILDPTSLLETWGTVGLLLIVFAESGLLVGFFLPGDSLLFTAGLLASSGRMNIAAVAIGAAVAAVVGDQVGYTIGRRAGPMLFARENWLITPERVGKTERFFAKRGGRAILLARFVPIVRTFTPVLAGVVRMPYRSFVGWNVAGGVLWGSGVSLLGYALGESIPNIDRYLLPIIGVIIVVSVIPVIFELRRGDDEPERALDQPR